MVEVPSGFVKVRVRETDSLPLIRASDNMQNITHPGNPV
jgi:hypothetical protein